MAWIRSIMVFIGLFMLILGVSVTGATSLSVSAVLAFSGLALMIIFWPSA